MFCFVVLFHIFLANRVQTRGLDIYNKTSGHWQVCFVFFVTVEHHLALEVVLYNF